MSSGIELLENTDASETEFTLLDNRNIVAPDGTEYVHLSDEDLITVFGSHTFIGKIKDEDETSSPFDGHISWDIGVYSCEGDPDLNIIMRFMPDSEWLAYYRKASLPDIEISPDNCIRFEFIGRKEINSGAWFTPGIKHMSCNDGIKGQDDIQAFLADVRSQESPEKAGLYDLVRKPDGSLENCYEYGIVYGYFKDEPNLALPFHVISYNSKAYSIDFGYYENSKETAHVLPKEWLQLLKTKE